MPSCASMFGSSNYNMNIQVNDPNADIYYNNQKIGTGTAQKSIKRKKADEVSLTIKKDGCEEQIENFDTSVLRGWSIVGSAITWGIVGIAIDGLTGSWHKPDCNDMRIQKENCMNYIYKVTYKGCKDK